MQPSSSLVALLHFYIEKEEKNLNGHRLVDDQSFAQQKVTAEVVTNLEDVVDGVIYLFIYYLS